MQHEIGSSKKHGPLITTEWAWASTRGTKTVIRLLPFGM